MCTAGTLEVLNNSAVRPSIVPCMLRSVIFRHYVAIGICYNGGVCHYSNVAVMSWFLPAGATLVLSSTG